VTLAKPNKQELPGSSVTTRSMLHRCDQFVGRTMNWLYDHLRFIPRYEQHVIADGLVNRDEFPLLDARALDDQRLSRRIWRRTMGDRLYPTDARWLKQCRATILHSHFGHNAIEDFALQAAMGVPWIVSFYGADVYELGLNEQWREKYTRLFERIHLALALGPQMAARLAELGVPQDKIAVHALGVDLESIPVRERTLGDDGTLKLLFAGTFREKKGAEYMLRAAAKARQGGVRLHVTLVGDATTKPGDRETKEQIFRDIRTLGLEDVVTHHPYVEFSRLMDIALASHIFVAPSVTAKNGDAEGTPFVLQQMMASAMPVIATEHSDIPFILGPHRHLLVPERDSDAIAARLQWYADDPQELIVHGRQLRERIRDALDVRPCAARLADVYDGVLA